MILDHGYALKIPEGISSLEVYPHTAMASARCIFYTSLCTQSPPQQVQLGRSGLAVLNICKDSVYILPVVNLRLNLYLCLHLYLYLYSF